MLRSGRVELWLETRLPDEDARAAILSDKLSELPPPIGAADISRIASSSSGLTGADLKSVVDDAKLLFAHDRAQGKEPRPAEEYFLMAIESVRNNRRKYGRSRPPRLGESVRFGFSVA
jgi:ATP-dependent 26S proteasome regulatory subunit